MLAINYGSLKKILRSTLKLKCNIIMKNKKIVLVAVFALLTIILSGCFEKDMAMNSPKEDGSYHYPNKDLGFSMDLPAEFIYFQTQSKDSKEITKYKDIEIFVPTSDKTYFQEVEGYAKPIVIRIYSKSDWKQIDNNNEAVNEFKKIEESKNSVYLIKYWDTAPKDWEEKWNDEIIKKIEAGFKLE